MTRLARATALALALGAAACSTVKPWERGTLAHPSMDPEAGDRIACEEFVHHVFDVREGTTDCSGRAGGGCGCN